MATAGRLWTRHQEGSSGSLRKGAVEPSGSQEGDLRQTVTSGRPWPSQAISSVGDVARDSKKIFDDNSF